MIPVLKAQWRKDKRSPWTIIAFVTASILLTILFSGGSHEIRPTVAIFSNEVDASAIEAKWEPLLNNSEQITFEISNEEDALKNVAEGNRQVAIELFPGEYKVIANNDGQTVQLVQSYVHKVFTEEVQIEAVARSLEKDSKEVREQINHYLDSPPMQNKIESIDDGDLSNYDMSIHLLFGFTFFMAMFTIGFKVNAVSTEKVSGLWDRMILSPISKTGMYTGHLLYSFLTGFLQILLVLVIFNYGFDYDLGDNFGLVMIIAAVFTVSMVSVAMLFTAIVRTPDHFYMTYPSIIPIIPLISGAYMPPGIITNPVLLFIADLFPLKHAMNALTSVAFYDAGFGDIALSIVLMLLIGVICMGIGINLVERRSE